MNFISKNLSKFSFLILLVFAGFSCKKSTSYQIVIFNDLPEQASVKIYASSINLIKDSIVLSPSQQYEIFFKEEDGLNSVYQCKNLLDSAFTYSNGHKIRVDVKNVSSWTYSENPGKYKEEHNCTLSIGSGDIIQ